MLRRDKYTFANNKTLTYQLQLLGLDNLT